MRLFSSIALTYELVNHVLTFGLDIVWRRHAGRLAAGSGGSCWLDVCTGTGEMARYLARNACSGTRVFALDRNREMLDIADRTPSDLAVRYIEGDVYRLPFADGAFDLVTISFAARTLATGPDQLERVFAEICRVTAPGGRFVVVETSQPESPLIRWLFHRYVALVVIPVGALISGSRDGYVYLAHTIPRFPDADLLDGVLLRAGFGRVSHRRFLFGAAAMHCTDKDM